MSRKAADYKAVWCSLVAETNQTKLGVKNDKTETKTKYSVNFWLSLFRLKQIINDHFMAKCGIYLLLTIEFLFSV